MHFFKFVGVFLVFFLGEFGIMRVNSPSQKISGINILFFAILLYSYK